VSKLPKLKSINIKITQTGTNMDLSREKIQNALKAKGYVWFESGDYDLNIVGVRNHGTAVTNIFDDFMTVSYKVAGEWKFFKWACTTDPGTKAVKEFHNPTGVARVVPGQYRGVHQVGLHQGKYTALVQRGPITVYRDLNKDMVFDEAKKETGIFGINIHHASGTGTSTYVENWSEGCQVFANIKDFESFMLIIDAAVKTHGNSFTYTLLDSGDIP
jgi:hypothetical protein